MKSTSLLCVAAMLSLATISQAQTWNLEYGNKEGQLAYFNSNSNKDFAEDAPMGPMSFRVDGKRLWVLDSIAGDLCSFDENGKELSSVTVPNLSGFRLLEDFAFAGDVKNPESVWIANAADGIIRRISLADGKELTSFGGNNKDSEVKIQQVHQLEADSKNNLLYVGDYGRNAISVFSFEGKYLREVKWQGTDFALDKASNLHVLHYSETTGYMHQIYSPKGQLVASQHVGLPTQSDGNIVSIEDDGSMVCFFTPVGGFKGVLNLYRINKSGNIVEKADFIPQPTMNRRINVCGGKVFIAEADFHSAPDGKFAVKEIKWEPFKNDSAAEGGNK